MFEIKAPRCCGEAFGRIAPRWRRGARVNNDKWLVRFDAALHQAVTRFLGCLVPVTDAQSWVFCSRPNLRDEVKLPLGLMPDELLGLRLGDPMRQELIRVFARMR